MPWAYPLGQANGFTGLGGPLLASRLLFPDMSGSAVTLADDFYSVLAHNDRLVLAFTNTSGAASRFIGMETVNGVPEMFVNALGGTTSRPIYADFSTGGFILINDTTGVVTFVDSVNPATAVFTPTPVNPPSPSGQVFGLANGQIASINPGAGQNLSVTRDHGNTWSPNVSFNAALGDIDHAGGGQIVPHTGRYVALTGVIGTGITDDPENGIPALINVLPVTAARTIAGDFSDDGQYFVWTESGNNGQLFYSVFPFAAVNQIPIAQNAMQLSATLGATIKSIRFSSVLNGWVVTSGTGTPLMCGFIPYDVPPSQCLQGIWIETVQWSGTGSQHNTEVDREGGIIATGANMTVSTTLNVAIGTLR